MNSYNNKNHNNSINNNYNKTNSTKLGFDLIVISLVKVIMGRNDNKVNVSNLTHPLHYFCIIFSYNHFHYSEESSESRFYAFKQTHLEFCLLA